MYIYSKPCDDYSEYGIKKISIHETKHVPEIKSYAYSICFNNNKKIFYSGDISEINEELLRKINNNYYDEIYIDTCIANYVNNVHLNIFKLEKLINKDIKKHIYCIHYDDSRLITIIKEIGFNCVELRRAC